MPDGIVDAAAELQTLANEPAFRRALMFTLAREGCDLAKGDTGYVDNPNDPGGATNYGITQGTYSAYLASLGLPSHPVRDITPAEVAAIYRRNYWHDSKADTVASAGKPLLALAHFDAAVNLGLGQAAKCLQRAVGVTDDGVIGSHTLAAVLACDEGAALDAYLVDRARVYRAIVERRPASVEFLPGWLARVRWVARECGRPIDPSFAAVRAV